MAMDCAPPLSRGDVIAELEWRSDGIDGLGPLADASHRNVTVVQYATKNALVDVDALDLVEADLERAALDEAGLVDNAHIGDVGLSGPAMEPGLQGPVKRHDRHHGRGRQTQQDDAFGGGLPRQQEEEDGHDPGRNRRQIEDPVRIGRIQHLFAGLQDIVDITPHWSPQLPSMPSGGMAGTRLLARNGAVMYTRLFARASCPLCAPPIPSSSGNAPRVMGRLV